jgi:hypothetical protein
MTITVNKVEYDETKFNDLLKNYLVLRQEIQTNRIRLIAELEKIDVLTGYYDNKITEELKNTEEGKNAPASNIAVNTAENVAN